MQHGRLVSRLSWSRVAHGTATFGGRWSHVASVLGRCGCHSLLRVAVRRPTLHGSTAVYRMSGLVREYAVCFERQLYEPIGGRHDDFVGDVCRVDSSRFAGHPGRVDWYVGSDECIEVLP